MRDELLYLLNQVLDSSDYLLQETILNDLQRKFLHSIHKVALNMRQLIVMTPPDILTIERVREMFSFETREHLASIIGYAEVLTSQEEGDLDQTQHQHIDHIHANATELFSLITDILE